MKVYAHHFNNGMVDIRFQKMTKAEIKRYEQNNDCKLVKITTD